MTLYEYDDRLKPCPFCNKKAWLASIEFRDGDIWFSPQCSECKAMWKENYETKEDAISEWNKR